MNAYGVGLAVPHPNIEGDVRIDRTRPPRTPATALRMRFERFDLDEENARLVCDGKPVDLPPRPFEVLCALARRPGSLVTKNALLDEVWGHRFVSESVLKTAIGKLRTALQDDARKPRFIETVSRRGYRFIAAGSGPADTRGAGRHIEHRNPHVPPARLNATGITAESALREIREMLLLLIEQPHERQGAAARIVDYIAGCTLKAANEGR
jgi:DNA-binding winged helix-turn-helix (wHTH) protein